MIFLVIIGVCLGLLRFLYGSWSSSTIVLFAGGAGAIGGTLIAAALGALILLLF